MKTSISHIPKYKQEEIQKLVEIVKNISKNKVSIEMIILFWPYARGDFVENNMVHEWGTTLEYNSDIQVLLVTRKPTQEKNMNLSRKILSEVKKEKSFTSHVSLLLEDIYHINAKLEELSYFYMGIKKEGIILYDSQKCILKWTMNLSGREKICIQEEDFDIWFYWAREFILDYQNAFQRWSYRNAIFFLHQAAERFIAAYLLVKTWYKPKTHDLEILYSKLKWLNPLFNNWFDLSIWSWNENYYFALLKRAYVDSRYKKKYCVQKEDLEFLEIKISYLEKLVRELCDQELKE